MAPTEILAVLTATPFVPFRMRLSNGATYDIDKPYTVLVGNRFVHVGIPTNPGDEFPDRTVRLDPIHITELIPLANPPTPGGNGTPLH